MESFVRDASSRTYRLLCKYHLLYDTKFLIDYYDTITREEEEEERSKIKFKNVANSNRVQQSQQSRGRRSSFRWNLAFIYHFIEFRILYYTALWIFNPQISDRMQVLLLNQFALEHFDSRMQFFFILNFVLALDMLRLVYVRNRGLTFRVLREAIVANRNSFFLEPRFGFSNRIFRFFVSPNDLISQQLLSVGILMINIFSIMLCLAYLHTLNLASVQLRAHQFSPLEHAIFWLSLALNLLTNNLILHILLLVGINGTLATLAVYVKLKQTEHFVRRHFPRKSITSGGFSGPAFQRFRAVIVSTLHIIEDGNRIYGKAFFNFILTNVPLNSQLFSMLLVERLSRSTRLLVIAIIVLQLSVLIVMHIFAVVLYRRFHRPVKYFFHFIADPDLRVRGGRYFILHELKPVIDLWRLKDNNNNNNNCNNYNYKYRMKEKIKQIKKSGKFPPPQQRRRPSQQISLRLRLQIARYIGDFHTNKQYTANYGKYGAITFATIQKQIFYNIKLIIFSYMLYQSKKLTESKV